MENQSQRRSTLEIFSELFGKGFSRLGHDRVPGRSAYRRDRVVCMAFFRSSIEWARYAAIWAIVHCLLGSFSTTVYTHRLITHNAAKSVSASVHAFFVSLARFSVQVVFVIGQQITRCITA